MGPEYRRLVNMPSDLRVELCEVMEELGIDPTPMLYKGGIAFKKNGHIFGITSVDNLSESVRADARKETSVWHVVLPIDGSSKGDKMGGAIQYEDGVRPSFSKKHRGKHRTHTKGKGFKAINRNFDSFNLGKRR